MSVLFRRARFLLHTYNSGQTVTKTVLRESGYYSSPFLVDVDIKAKYNATSLQEDWKYVERLLPPTTVPEPLAKANYLSGWKPQAENLENRPYFISRTKNHMIPVYLKITQRGIKRHTYVKKIQGDIWLLDQELQTFLSPMCKSPLRMQIHEFAGFICINGDYVNAIKHWLMERGY